MPVELTAEVYKAEIMATLNFQQKGFFNFQKSVQDGEWEDIEEDEIEQLMKTKVEAQVFLNLTKYFFF